MTNLETLANEFDDIEVDEHGKCNWADVANAQTHLRAQLRRAASRPAQKPVARPFLGALAKTAKIMRSAHDKGGDRLMSIWEDDVQAVEAALLSLTGENEK